jgi:cell division protein FtsN
MKTTDTTLRVIGVLSAIVIAAAYHPSLAQKASRSTQAPTSKSTKKLAQPEDFWVVIASLSNTQEEPAIDRARTFLRCSGELPIVQYSELFEGFRPGLIVVMTGSYTTREQAIQTQARFKRCAADSFVKRGRFLATEPGSDMAPSIWIN